jgi:hypothetical protein
MSDIFWHFDIFVAGMFQRITAGPSNTNRAHPHTQTNTDINKRKHCLTVNTYHCKIVYISIPLVENLPIEKMLFDYKLDYF